jgi:Dehydrogenases with different specificities (related to short-chain alcohol dehydrogenases)
MSPPIREVDEWYQNISVIFFRRRDDISIQCLHVSGNRCERQIGTISTAWFVKLMSGEDSNMVTKSEVSERFEGKVVVVTGAAGGLGKATACAFASLGADLAICDVDAEGLASVAEELAAVGATVFQRAIDLAEPAACRSFLVEAADALSGIDVLVNVAGILGFTHVADVTEKLWNKIMAVNLSAPFWLSQAALPYLLARGGNIVNVASSGAIVGEAYLVPYTASKAALMHMTKSMAMEFIKQNIRINAIAPGAMITNIASHDPLPKDADLELFQRFTSIRPAADPAQVADLIVYLASDRASNIHGTCLSTDAGITAG